MKKDISKRRIQGIHCRRILNSHVEFTTEFIIALDDGTVGVGSAPRGETVSIYEKDDSSASLSKILKMLKTDRLLNIPLNQTAFDAFLQQRINVFGRNNCYALSMAFLDATKHSHGGSQLVNAPSKHFPHICLNVLNGGAHAYTNPVLSDFPEFLLVSKSLKLDRIIADHNSLQTIIREKLAKCDKVVVNGNVVNKLGSTNNDCLEFLLNALDELDLASEYDLMIDASAGNMWTGSGYRFLLTDGSLKTSSELCNYWLDLTGKYRVKLLEDPFQEQDFDSWKTLSGNQSQCRIIGDNFYSSDPRRIRDGANKGYTHGVILKPDQAGTVSVAINAIKVARSGNQFVVASHRSISTESTFLSTIANMYQIDYVKIGPLLTDYSAIIRLNELIRLSGIGYV
jgi:enolase